MQLKASDYSKPVWNAFSIISTRFYWPSVNGNVLRLTLWFSQLAVTTTTVSQSVEPHTHAHSVSACVCSLCAAHFMLAKRHRWNVFRCRTVVSNDVWQCVSSDVVTLNNSRLYIHILWPGIKWSHCVSKNCNPASFPNNFKKYGSVFIICSTNNSQVFRHTARDPAVQVVKKLQKWRLKILRQLSAPEITDILSCLLMLSENETGVWVFLGHGVYHACHMLKLQTQPDIRLVTYLLTYYRSSHAYIVAQITATLSTPWHQHDRCSVTNTDMLTHHITRRSLDSHLII